jgi:hypothetical protein
MQLRLAGLTIGVLVAGSAYAQYVISAHSGVIQVVEGKAYLNDKAIETKFGQFPDIKTGQEFRTEDGRAEILLTPGVFLRLGANSSIKMVSNALSDTRVEVLGGSAIVEADEIPKDNSIELMYKGSTMMLVKHGLYRVNTEPAALLQVYDGEAIVKGESGQLTLHAGKETALTGVLMATNFDKKDTDELYSWSSRRAGYLSTANASSAMTMKDSGYAGGFSGYSGYPGMLGYGGWQFNPMFGMFTYVPMMGFGYSPFGYGWFSPYSIGYYAPYFGGYYPGYYGGYAAGRPGAQIASLGSSRGFANNSSPISRGGFGGFHGATTGARTGGFGGMARGGFGGMAHGASAGGGGGGMAGGGGHGGGGGGHR